MITLPAQFLPVAIVPNAKGGTDKFPLDRAGNTINAHDSSHWMTQAEARACKRDTIGFVFTANDPYFLLDLDDRRQADGTWDAESQAICARFAGAAMEISNSGRGIHIIGRCNKWTTADRRNKWQGFKGEFYITGQFVAFGKNEWIGSPEVDCTAAILATVPAREIVAPAAYAGGVDPSYTGPADDDELIRMMLASRPSVSATFGNKATIEQLWKADPVALAKAYPPVGPGNFDHSSADLALLSHLAFWTGRDATRMDRLFRRSGLMREKYANRPDYGPETIGKANTACRRVYDHVRTATPAAAPPVSGEYLTIDDQLTLFAGCTYVRNVHKIMIPGGDLLDQQQFRVAYGGHEFQMSGTNTKPTRNAFEAFTENRAHRFPRAVATRFLPSVAPGAMIGEEINAYFPKPSVTREGDPGPFLDCMMRQLPIERDRQILISYMAQLVRNPGSKFQWSPVVQGVRGGGKSLMGDCLAYAVGPFYTHKPQAEDLGNKFNDFLEHKILIYVEEIYTKERRELLDMLKPIITSDRIEVQGKGEKKRMVDNVSNWYCNTNHRDAIVMTKDERRYAVFFSAMQTYQDIVNAGMGGNYFPRLWTWLRNGGFEIVAHWLRHRAIVIPEFDPNVLGNGEAHRAPATSSVLEAIEESLGRAEQETLEAIGGQSPGFMNGWISSAALTKYLREHNIRLGPKRLRVMLGELGYIEACRSTRLIIQEGDSRPVLFVRDNLFRPGLTVDDYIHAQGWSGAAVMPVRLVR